MNEEEYRECTYRLLKMIKDDKVLRNIYEYVQMKFVYQPVNQTKHDQ